MVFPAYIWIVFAVSLVFCCMGFYSFVWFMSVGYGMSSAAIGAAMIILALTKGQFNVFYLIQGLLLVVYGIRLGGFLLIRNLKNEKYKAKLKDIGGEARVPFFVAVFMWLYCGALYVCEAAPFVYRLANDAVETPNAAMYIGLVISLIGVVMEAVADKQKSKEKELNPNMPAMHGLFKMCRCPNYLGEILFWTGIFVSGFGMLQGWQWLVALLGYVQIVYIMFAGAKRLEKRHIKNYGDKPEYNAYADSTPILIPLIPYYHTTTPEKIAAEEAKKAAKKAAKSKK